MLKPLSSAILLTLCFNSAIAQEAPTELDPITVNGDAVGSGGQDVVNVGGSGPWDWTSDDTAERDDTSDYGDDECQGGKTAYNKIRTNLVATGVSCKASDEAIIAKVCRKMRCLRDLIRSGFKPGSEGLVCEKRTRHEIKFRDGSVTFECNGKSSQDCGQIIKRECR